MKNRVTICRIYGTAEHRHEVVIAICTMARSEKVFAKLEERDPNARYCMRPTEAEDYALV